MSKYALKFNPKDARSRSKTQQNFRDTVNVNTIMKKAHKTGVLPVLGDIPHFADYSNVTDYQDSLNKVMAIDVLFAELPSGVRTKFGNDPDAILKFLNDPKNDAEARKIGLIRPLTFLERVEKGLINPDGSAIKKLEPKPKVEETPV